MEASEFVEDFGQKVDLTQRIREVLLNYPEGTTILKELVQNADDAGATKVCFCVDRRQHGVQSLMSRALAEWQGPALLAYNNAQFTEEDFQSISRIGDSRKQEHAWKTGRFGIGFNSVYHLSDLPSFVSGKYVVIFDPHCKYLPSISSSNPGKRIDFVSSSGFERYSDQFAPYCAFGCDMEHPFPGTLFRFPLRSAEQAAVSRLSRQGYTSDDMFHLLQDLYSEAVQILLFLKNVEVIEIYEWTSGASCPSQLYSCFVQLPTSALRLHRQMFVRQSRQLHSGVETREQADVFRLDLASRSHQGADSGKENISSFLIAQIMGSSTSRIGVLARIGFKRYGLRLLPWASVAAKISSLPGNENKQEGRAFCFLPLPLKTGMSIHVNGYFELSANRRDIWYGSDMDRLGKFRSDWNNCILEDVAASCLLHLLSEARKLGSGPSYYSMWPVGSFREPWDKMVQHFYRNVKGAPLLYSPVGEGRWLTLVEAIFHDEEYDKSDVLASALIAEGLPLVRLPTSLRNALFKHCEKDLNVVTPYVVRRQIQKNPKPAERPHVFTLLDYCLLDLVDEEAAEQLMGLWLIPLQNQMVGRFDLAHGGSSYYLCNSQEQRLLESIPSKIVAQNLPQLLLERLSRIALSGQSNICCIDDTSLGELLQYLLPSEWKNCEEVIWKPGIKANPSKEWLSFFWEYLCVQQRNLSKLQEWPILPTNLGTLRRLKRNSGILLGGKIEETMETVLTKGGCAFSDRGISIQHPQLSRYVFDPTAAEVLDGLAYSVSCDFSLLAQRFASLSGPEKKELRSFIYNVAWINKTEMNEFRLKTLKSLPIFEAYNDSGDGLTFITVEGFKKFLAPKGVDDRLLGIDFLHSSNPRETEILSQLLGVVPLKKAEFFKWRVISRITEIPAETRDPIMLQILRDLSELSYEDRSLMGILKSLKFVPTGIGKLDAPDNLYDPESLELLNLLNEPEFFPAAPYATSEVLQALRNLGLKSTVTPDTVLASARNVESLLSRDPVKAVERGRVLLSYLDANSGKWLPSMQEAGIGWILSKASSLLQGERDAFLTKFWNDLANICWCPVLTQPPHPQMPWPTISQPLAPPRLVRLASDIWLVSATMRILDGTCQSPGLSQCLGWSSRLGCNILAAQLLELGRNDNHQLGKVLATTIPRVYSLLSDMLGTDEMEIVKVIFEDRPWVWVGTGFTTSKKVVFDGPSHLAPYLYIVPADLAAFKELFMELGVRESLEPLDYSNILSVIAGERPGNILDSRQLRAVVWIVQYLADMKFGDQGIELFVPDYDGILRSSCELVYNDAPWLLALKDGHTGSSNISEKKKFVHAKISNDVAEKVGISSVRKYLLAESADFMDLGVQGGMEAFGQSESLTNRLKQIVEMYADGPGILFELLQNADDAGASETCFLLDKTSYGTDSVLCRQMADWQGPALYCYNNSVFKPEDLRAISRIGQNSKLEKPSAIGRFGLGFNSVYHFTDVPGFVSGTNIVMLDPHAANLPGITPAQPGLKINFVGKSLLKQFPDQFQPFLMFGCDLQRPFEGTLFRFPLRTTTTAARSEIKQDACSSEDVVTLFTALKNLAGEVMLFLRNVKTIKVYVRENDLQEVFKVEKENVSYQESSLYEFVRGTGEQRNDREEFVKRLERTPDKRLPWSCGKIKLVLSSEQQTSCSSWLISSALGGGKAKEFAVASSNRSRGFVPWAGIAAKLPEDGNAVGTDSSGGLQVDDSRSLLEGRAFCFLPLPVEPGIPVHVNGYFELSANRRDVWYGGDMVGGGRLRSQWNGCLLEDAGAPAYARLLHQAAQELGPSSSFYSLWPSEHAAEPWKLLVQQVYKVIVDLELPVLYTATRRGKWISAKQAVFPDFSFSGMDELGNALLDIGLPLVRVTKTVAEKFRQFCPTLRFLTPQLFRRLLIASKRTFEGHISALALKYAMADVETPEDEAKLYGLSLVPLANGSFGTFNSRAAGEKIILADEKERKLLIPALTHSLVAPELADDVMLKLKQVAANGVSNVFLITAQLLQELLGLVLPLDWAGKESVIWAPGVQGHPTVDWMELLWRFLARHCDDLSAFASWPLLPTSEGRLLRLVKCGSVLLNDGWSENMASLLQKCGCFLLRADMPIKHPSLRDYVQDASGRGILLAMFSAAGGNLKMLPTLLRDCSGLEIRELRQFLFQSKWFTSSQMDAVEMEILRMLRLFENDDNFFCIAESKQLIAPDDIDQQLLTDMFIRAKPGKEEQILQTCLGLRKLTKEEYFREYFVECFRLIPLGKRMDVFQKVAMDLRQHMELVSDSMSVLSQLPFVPTDSGAIEPPKRLYDPRVSELQTLLNKQAFFPSDDFQKNMILDMLVLLGLRRSLGREGLLDCARSVAMLSNTDDSEASARGKALLTHLDSLLVSEGSLESPPEDQDLWVELSNISWCPVCVTSPNPFLPWLPGQLTSVASPKVVRPPSDIWLVSGSMRILDGNCGSTLQAKLGWKQAPNSGVLANQLIELCSCYRQLQKSEKGLDDIITSISKEVKTIYTIFSGLLETEGLMVLQSMLEGHAWLWIGEGFVMARDAAFDAPGHFHPYLHVVPMELLEFKELFTSLGVRETFGAADYVNVLQRVAVDLKGDALNSEQLTFVLRSLEALGETFQIDYDSSFGEVLMPDAASYLVPAKELVYNDAPWLAESFQGVGGIVRLVHPDVDTNLARQLGARSLRYLSVVDQEMTSSLPCMGMEKISDMLSKFGNQDFLFFDLIEVADCCQARKVHFVYDSQEHPKQSLLQPNLGDFQGPALVVVFEGVDLSTDEICGLHTSPPVRFHGQACRYGSGLLAAYHVTNLLLVISSGSLYLYDPSGQVIVPALADGRKDPTGNPIGKAFSLQGTGLSEKFSDQFRPFNINHEMSWRTRGLTILRLPLRPAIDKPAVVNLFNNFKQHAANCLLFLKSVEAVTLSEWTNPECFREVFSVSLGSAFAALRHPFQEKKWRKFQLSNFFGSSNAATKTHTIDVFLKEESTTTMTKWLVVQSLASGQTRDMALDRRYLHYQLTPVAGVAACISLDGGVTDSYHGSFLSPLPVPLKFKMPVTIFGNFLLFLDGERHFFNEALGDYPVKAGMLGSHTGPSLTDEVIRATWNRHLLSCVCDSYIELLQELQHLLIGRISATDSKDSQPGRNSYSLWPRSNISESSASDAQCLVKWLLRPMYARLVDIPVWQLHSGNMVKFTEGVFVAPSGQVIAPQASVSDFFKAHYRVFNVPWELGKEAEGTGAAMKELTPKALRSLMKVPSVAAAVQSVVTQVDLLEYCCADALPKDINLDGTSDNLEINKAVLAELKGVTCPTANEFMVKLGTLEVWIANKEQQKLLPSLGKRFVHPSCLERPLLAALFNNRTFQLQMNLKSFSPRMIAANIWTVLPRNWADAGPWVEWEQEPSVEWIRNIWKNVKAAVDEELSLFVSWPLIPARIGSSRILVHVGQRQLVFVPPLSDNSPREDNLCGSCTKAFSEIDDIYPWLMQVLGKLGIPVYNRDFLDCDAVKCCITQQEKSLVQTIVSKLVALEDAGCLQPSRAFLTPEECAKLFTLLATLTLDDNSWLTPQEISVLRSLPIFKTSRDNYVELDQSLHYTVSPGAFMQPDDEQCLPAANAAIIYELLGIPQLTNSGILTRYALPNFSHISSSEQEKVLGHIYHNWDVLRQEATVVNALKETKFVRCASASSTNLFSPQELLDPESVILKQIFNEDGWRFPGGQFATSRWIQILRSAGLRSLKDPSLILECATKIQELGRQDVSSHELPLLKYGSTTSSQNISEAVWSLASALVEEILNNLSAVYSSSFCDTLSKLSFIPAEKGLPTSIGGAPSRVLASYSEAVLLKDWPLAWTCSPLLTRPTVVPPEFSWGAFHLRSPPLISVVIKHLRAVGHNGGEDVLARWPNMKGSRSVEEVFGDLLQYLSNVWDGLSDADKKELSVHAFIPVANGTRLVTASSLYTRLGMDLAPFVFEVPRAYLSYVDILTGLGMQYEPTVPTMKALLLELQQTCGYQHLNPNELQAVLYILQFICENAKDVSNQDFAVDVVVPDENGRLVHATSCAYVDTAGVPLVDKIDASKIRFVHSRLSEGLCTLLCVKKLSAIILEEIDERKPLEFVDSLGEFSLSSVRQLLGSDAFGESVWAILQGGFKETVNTELNKKQVLDALLFGAQNLRFVKRLCTRYFLLPGRTDVTREKSEQQAFYFVKRSADIVLAAEPPEFVAVTDLLAVLVSRILDSPVCLPIGPLFNVPIDKYGDLQHVVKFIDNGGRVHQRAENQAMLGALVLPVDAKALQFCPLRPFYAGEIVGWHHNRQQSHETYYGRVVEDIRAPAGHPIYHIRVETSPGNVQLLSSSNVLSFKSTGSLTLGEQKKNPSQTFVENKSVASTSSTVALDSQTEAPDVPRVLDPQAVTDILKSLGLPLSLERQSLLEHTLSLQEQLTSANALLLTEQERADASVRDAEAVKSSWTCKVCLSLEVDSMLVPCGHVMCHLCSSAMSRCPFCRKFVTSAHAMYRP